MSIELVKKEILRFLSSESPNALVIKGGWGVGKTFSWKKLVFEAVKNNEVKLGKYSYVSLFGLESLSDLKFSIFENQISIEKVGEEPNLQNLSLNLKSLKNIFSKKSLGFLRGLNLVSQNDLITTSAAYLFINKTIICLDDLERAGKNLRTKDVLGLVSQLKEQKNCKVVLILNDDAFDSEEDADDFKKYLEKAVDIELEYEPTPGECVEIALSEENYISNTLSQRCWDLDIKNIRVIKKIERLAKIIIPILEKENFEEEVLNQAIHTLTLLGWSFYSDGEDVIDYNYIKQQVGHSLMGVLGDEEKPEEQKRWNAKLRSYEFSSFDGFDNQIAFAIENGYFNDEGLLEQGAARNKEILSQKADNSFQKAWDVYHASFDDNEKEVVKGLHSSFLKNYEAITPLNVNGTVNLFRELGYDEKADEFIEFYFANKTGKKKFFDLASGFFSVDDKIDSKFAEAMKKKFESFSPELNLKDVLLHINKNRSWGNEHISFLVGCKEKDFYDLFKNEKGKTLRSVINGALDFETIQGAEENWLKISKKARKALEKIGKESKINKRRVRKYGVFIK